MRARAAIGPALLFAIARASAGEDPPTDGEHQTVVRAARDPREPVSASVRSEEASRIAGTGGDPLKVVDDLPGVARSPAGTGQLVVWGSAPSDTKVVLDGIEIPALYHFGGLRGTIGGDLVRSIALSPGGWGADCGRGLGGLVRIEGRKLPGEGTHGDLSADLLDASASLSTVAGSVRLAASGRYSYLDRLLSGVVTSHAGDLFSIPRYDDFQIRAAIDLGSDEDLTATFLGSDDHLQRSQPSADPAAVRSDSNDRSFYRLMLRYKRLFSDGASVEVTPFAGFDRNRQASAFGGSPARLDSDGYSYGLRGGYRKKLAEPFTLALGVDLLGTRASLSRSGSLTIPAREGDIYLYGQPPGGDVNSDDWTTHVADAGLYASGELRVGRLSIIPGVRLDGVLVDGSRLSPKIGATPPIGFTRVEWALDPRLWVNYRATPRVALSAGAGLYHQPPAPEDLSAVFGNPSLGLSRALHVTGGGSLKIGGALTVEATGFYKQMDQLPSRSALPAPLLAQALTGDGIGRGYGAQIMVRQDPWHHLSGWITYTISRSERKDHPGDSWRLFDYDQTHVLGIVASFDYRGFVAGLRFRYSTGMPRTPVIGSFLDARDDQYQPIFGPHNSSRLPEFAQLDARIEKSFVFGRIVFRIYLDVQNVTWRKNAEEVVYNYNFTQPGYITGLPTLALLGGRLQF